MSKKINYTIIGLISILILLAIGTSGFAIFQYYKQTTSLPSSSPLTVSSDNQSKNKVIQTPNPKQSVFPILSLKTGSGDEKLFDQSGKEYINTAFQGATAFSSDSNQIIANLPNKVAIWNFKNDTYKNIDKIELIPVDNKIQAEFRVIDSLSIDQNKIYYRILESVEMYDKESASYNLCGNKKCGVFEYDLENKTIRKIVDDISHSQYDDTYSSSITEVKNSKITLSEAKGGGSVFQLGYQIIDLVSLKVIYLIEYISSDIPASPNPNIQIQVTDKSKKSLLDINCDYIVDTKPNKDCISSLKIKIEGTDLLGDQLKQEFLSDVGRRVEQNIFVENCGKYQINNRSVTTFENKDFKLGDVNLYNIKCIK